MKILGIETSCDETAVSIIEAKGNIKNPKFKILGNALYSQTKIHEQYGGVFPMMAKREHAKNLVPLLVKALDEAKLTSQSKTKISNVVLKKIEKILEREQGLFDEFVNNISSLKKPKVNYIAVTFGPGLEPALWVGVNFAKALSILWDIPIIPINHMEGHAVSVLFEQNRNEVKFPALITLMSGGHTELVVMKDWTKYTIIGETRDDAVGEAFDKVARMLGLPYPGGPHISRLAALDREKHNESKWTLPRPMIKSDDFDFSFSGLKTAVLYTLKKLPKITPEIQRGIAREFEDSVADVLTTKIEKAVRKFKVKSVIIGGGVSANIYIRKKLGELAREMDIELFLPTPVLSTDNAIMIALAAYVRVLKKKVRNNTHFKAEGNAKIK